MIASVFGHLRFAEVALKSRYDAIVVGGGPSGSTLACQLAQKGLDVLVIDKSFFPRPKCCGGGVTVRAHGLLGGLPAEVYEDTISSAQFGVRGSPVFDGRQDSTLMFTVSRDKFDHLLLQRAHRAGAAVLEGVSVETLSERPESVEVGTTKGTFEARFLFGADGSRSIVARYIGVQNRDGFVGIETELVVSDKDLARWKSLVLVDIGWTPKGYAWVFPKRRGLSVGIGCQVSHAKHLRRAYGKFLDSLELEEYETTKSWGGFIPTCPAKPRVARGRIALLGDAAGLADPLTGEGIGNAALSAHLASAAVCKALSQGVERLTEYQLAVEHTIVPDIEAARFFSRIIFTMPKKLLEVARLDGRIWNAACAVVRGDTSYSSIKGRVGGVGGLYSILRGKSGRLQAQQVKGRS